MKTKPGFWSDVIHGRIAERVAEGNAPAKAEKRALGSVPWQPWNNPFMRFDIGGPAHPSKMVYGSTVEGSLALPALYAGTKLLASSTASLPLKVYSTRRDGTRERYTGPSLFDKPSVQGTVYNWVFSAMTSLVLTGNAWGLITGTDGFGLPAGIEWIPTEFVQVVPDKDQPFNVTATRVYAYGREVRWNGPDKEVVHVASFTVPGRLEGLSLIQLAATTLLHGRTAQDYATRYLTTGGQAKGTFANTNLEVDGEQAEEIKRVLVRAMQRGEPLVHGADWAYTPIPQVSAADAQLIEAMGMNASQVAAMLDLPANRLAGTRDGLNYSSNIQEQIQILEALRPWLTCLESAFSEWLPNRRTVAFNTRAGLRMDPLTEAEVEQIERNTGTLTADEIRANHDRAPLPNGTGREELPLMVLQNIARATGGQVISWESQIAPPPEPPAPESPDDAEGDQGQESPQSHGEAA